MFTCLYKRCFVIFLYVHVVMIYCSMLYFMIFV